MKFSREQLKPNDDLTTALHTISEINRIIVAADTKVGLLLTANGFALTGLITASRTRTTVAVYMIGTALEAILLVCMVYLAATLWPSLRGAGSGNWFSFPSFPTEVDRRPTASVLADHAWRQAAVLAEIARRKYRRFGVALRCSAVSLVVFLIWFALSLFTAR